MHINNMLKEAEKIIPFNKIKPFFILLGTVGIIIIVGNLINSSVPNPDFYRAELSGRVYKIETRPRDRYFLIGKNWYLIKCDIIDKISAGDSINKTQDSYILEVFDKESKVKWQGEVKSLTFREVDRPE